MIAAHGWRFARSSVRTPRLQTSRAAHVDALGHARRSRCAASDIGPVASRCSSDVCVSSSPTTVSIRGVSSSNWSMRPTRDGGAAPLTCGRATRWRSRWPLARNISRNSRRRWRTGRRDRRSRRRARQPSARSHARRPSSSTSMLPTSSSNRHLSNWSVLGIELIGPEHLVRANVAVRGRAAPAPPSDRAAGFNRETIVQWTFAAAADDEETAISAAELARAEQAGASLLFAGHRWVRIDPAAVRKARARHDSYVRQLDAVGGDGCRRGEPAGPPPHRRRGRRRRRRAGPRRRGPQRPRRRHHRLAGVVGTAARRATRHHAARGGRATFVHRRAAPLSATRPQLAAVSRSPRARWMPRR